MTPPLSDDEPPDTSQLRSGSGSDPVRELAIQQVKRKRAFQRLAVGFAAASVFLIVIWAVSEYNNAGGWPTDGFSQSSSIPHVWNIWIIYPLLGMGLILAIDAWFTFRHRPISEREIQREIDRLTDKR
jgi:hypothetical protein